MLLGLNYPLHGYMHTFLFGTLVGLALGYITFLLEKFLHPLYKVLLLEASNGLKMKLKSFLIAGALGTGFHVLLDTPLYSDIKPFYPAVVNPLYNPSLILEIYGLCIFAGVFGIIYYFGLIALSACQKERRD
ncbi:MAG: hydrolase [Candidatus Bathyarchaeia archaeon]